MIKQKILRAFDWLFPIVIFSFLLFLSYQYYTHAGQFPFVDEFNNIVVAYFLLKGRTIYSEIFHNHQMLLPFISVCVQWILHPNSLFQLIVSHRLVVIVFAFCAHIVLFFRFGKKALLFAMVYEVMKYPLFGMMFQAESFIVYPIVYLFFLCMDLVRKKPFYRFDPILAVLFGWFIIFMREPYIPLALFLILSFFVLLIRNGFSKMRIIALMFLFACLLFGTVLLMPKNAYLFQLITVNKFEVASAEVAQRGGMIASAIDSLFYGFRVLFDMGFSRLMLVRKAAVLCAFVLLILFAKKRMWKVSLWVLVLMSLAAIRTVTPGAAYWEAYRVLLWWSLICATSAYLLLEMSFSKIQRFFFSVLYVGIFVGVILSTLPLFSRENIQSSYDQNYISYYVYGNIAKTLGNSHDTYFVNDYDSLSYWQSGLDSSYLYGLYYPVMTHLPVYVNERDAMFLSHPPTFYEGGDCTIESNIGIPSHSILKYRNLLKGNEQTCFFILEEKTKSITQEQWDTLRTWGFTLNPSPLPMPK